MDHAEARELMAARLAVPADAAADDAAARRVAADLDAHLAGCPDCAAEQRALSATAAALQMVIGPPRAARERVLANVAELGRERRLRDRERSDGQRGEIPTRRRGWTLARPRALAAAAAIALLAFVGGAVGSALLPRDDGSAQLARAAMMMAELAREPTSHAMTLTDASGNPGGTVIYEPTRQQLVVFSESLERPASGRYGCYVERAGERTWIGPMLFEADTAFWAGAVSAPADLGRPGDRFLVLRDEADLTPMLAASF